MPNQNSPILAPVSAPAETAVAFIMSRGSAYTRQDIETIAGHYWRFAPAAGIDPVIAIAQCIHETGGLDPATGKWRPLSAWWALRPRRNPAGIGVTGRAQHEQPADAAIAWAFDERDGTWQHGLSFPSWEVASRVHLGRLLGYARRDEQLDEAQRRLLDEALGWRPLAAVLRGSAPTLRLLGAKHNPTGRGWADPGENYGHKIAEFATAIQRQSA